MLADNIKELKKEFAAGMTTELRAHMNRTRSVSLSDGDIAGNVRSSSTGVSARVGKNGLFGFSSMGENSLEAGRAVLKAATSNAAFMNKNIVGKKAEMADIPKGTEELHHEIVETEQKYLIDYAKDLDSYIAKTCKNIKSRTVMCGEDSREKVLYTSDGYDAHTAIPRSKVYVTLVAETSEGKPVSLMALESDFGNFIELYKDPKDLYALIDKKYEALMKKREGIYAEAGVKQVVLGGCMAGMISHEAVGHTVEADLVRGGSVAGPYLNKMVASPLVSLTDFAHTFLGKRAPLPVYVDEEGTKCEDCEIIKDGKLIGFMNNRETAALYGQKPCGNARGYAFTDEPLVRMRNTTILPGKSKLEEMIASVEDGYYLIESGNGQADYTGEFIFGVSEGYEIKNGKLGRALLDTTVSGVAFDMLKTVDMVGDEVVWANWGTCGKKQPMPVSMGGPALRCKITIGGR